MVKIVKKNEAEKLIHDAQTFVLDVRTLKEYEMDSLERSTLIPLQELTQRSNELPEDKNVKILVYCAHGVRSLYACHFLQGLGFKNIFNLTGGLASYRAEK